MREELPENLNQQENLSDQNQEGENQLPEFVSRLDYEALQEQNAQLQRRLEILAQNMMSPDYVQYLESKRMAEYGGYRQPEPQPQSEPEPEFDPDTASQRDLVGVVEEGTARNIKSENYQIAGKTGTAQMNYGRDSLHFLYF